MLKLILLSLVVFSLGCDLDTNSIDSSGGSRGSGSSEWNNINWFTSRGPAGAQDAPQVMELVANIAEDGNTVNFAWDQIPWNSSGGRLEIRVHFFVWNDGANRWEGGMYEWIRPGGQSVKLLQNIRGGYNGLRAPAPGSRVAFAWTNERATERSNLAETVWR